MDDYRKHFTEEQMDKLQKAICTILNIVDANPGREGLRETPRRVAKMMEEVFQGSLYTNNEIAELFNKTFDAPGDDLVVISNIPAFSYCEHHMALMYNMRVSVAYIPGNEWEGGGKVIGLSKVARIVDLVCKRLQIQERIGQDIADILKQILCTDDIMVVIRAEHSCMTARGICKPGTSTQTAVISGRFQDSDNQLREEAYRLIAEGRNT